MVNVHNRNLAEPAVHDVYESMNSCQRRGVVRNYDDIRLSFPACLTKEFFLQHPDAHGR